jgi:hypothetical protein
MAGILDMIDDTLAYICQYLDGASARVLHFVIRKRCYTPLSGVEKMVGSYSIEFLNTFKKLLNMDELMRHAIISHNLRLVEWTYVQTGLISDNDIKLVAQSGSVEIFRWMMRDDIPANIMEYIVDDQCIDMNTGVNKHELRPKNSVRVLEMMKFAHSMRFPINTKTIILAARHGLPMMQWFQEAGLYTIRYSALRPAILLMAAECGHLDLLRWASEDDNLEGTEFTLRAAVSGSLEVMRWVRDHGAEWHDDVAMIITEADNFNSQLFDYVIENDCPIGPCIYTLLAKHGEFDRILKLWSKNHHPMMRATVLSYAITHKRFDIMKLLIQKGITMTNAIFAAIEIHDENLMKCLYGIGAPLNAGCWRSAIHYNNYDALNWLRRHDCPYYASVVQGCVNPKAENLEALEWFIAHDYLIDVQKLISYIKPVDYKSRRAISMLEAYLGEVAH